MKKRLISHYIEGFSSEEIARMEGVKSQAVSLSIRRAIKAIRKKIKKV
jgi:DNA-directed RNA polymerase specialized sigma24 family protein